MIEVKNLSFSYGKKAPILKNFTASFKPGINVIIGPNAAGKSTLLKCLFQLFPYEGSITIEGKDLATISTGEKMTFLGYLPQEESSSISLSVFEIVLLGCLPNLSWRVTPEQTQLVIEVLHKLHISHLATQKFSSLSGGQQKMVSIAQTLVRNPKVVLMDEPTNNLDLQKQLELCELIHKLSTTQDLTFIIILHDLNLAARFADQLYVLDGKGGLFAHGTPESILTPELLHMVYGVQAELTTDSKGVPVIIPSASLRNRS